MCIIRSAKKRKTSRKDPKSVSEVYKIVRGTARLRDAHAAHMVVTPPELSATAEGAWRATTAGVRALRPPRIPKTGQDSRRRLHAWSSRLAVSVLDAADPSRRGAPVHIAGPSSSSSGNVILRGFIVARMPFVFRLRYPNIIYLRVYI